MPRSTTDVQTVTHSVFSTSQFRPPSFLLLLFLPTLPSSKTLFQPRRILTKGFLLLTAYTTENILSNLLK